VYVCVCDIKFELLFTVGLHLSQKNTHLLFSTKKNNIFLQFLQLQVFKNVSLYIFLKPLSFWYAYHHIATSMSWSQSLSSNSSTCTVSNPTHLCHLITRNGINCGWVSNFPSLFVKHWPIPYSYSSCSQIDKKTTTNMVKCINY